MLKNATASLITFHTIANRSLLSIEKQLFNAIATNDIESVKQHVNAIETKFSKFELKDCPSFASVNTDGKNCLYLALELGHKEIADFLIEHFIKNKDDENWKNLHFNPLSIVTLNNQTSLQMAIQQGYSDIIQALIKANPDNLHFTGDKKEATFFNICDDEGNTPLSLAKEKGLTDVVQQLQAKLEEDKALSLLDDMTAYFPTYLPTEKAEIALENEDHKSQIEAPKAIYTDKEIEDLIQNNLQDIEELIKEFAEIRRTLSKQYPASRSTDIWFIRTSLLLFVIGLALLIPGLIVKDHKVEILLKTLTGVYIFCGVICGLIAFTPYRHARNNAHKKNREKFNSSLETLSLFAKETKKKSYDFPDIETISTSLNTNSEQLHDTVIRDLVLNDIVNLFHHLQRSKTVIAQTKIPLQWSIVSQNTSNVDQMARDDTQRLGHRVGFSKST